MAESSGEKTELPTPKKLRDARKKGQVCSSRDVVSTAILIVLMALVALMAFSFWSDFKEMMTGLVPGRGQPFADVAGAVGMRMTWVVCKYSFAFALIAALTGVIANIGQIGFLFAAEPVKPTLSKLNPAEGMKRIFSAKNLFEFLKNCLKVTFLGYLVYRLVMNSYQELLTLCHGYVADLLPILGSLLQRLAVYTAFGYIVIAVIDLIFQKRNYIKRMMMTKSEVKREFREMEGSQEIKGEQRRLRNELLFGPDLAVATRRADVIVTNPTHLSVGIRYRKDEFPLPKITVMGADRDAFRIRAIATEAGIPIMENIPLARRLYAEAKVEEFVPVELIAPVAEVLKWVKRLNEAKRAGVEPETSV